MNVSLIAATVFLLLLKVAATATFYIHVLRSGVHTCMYTTCSSCPT